MAMKLENVRVENLSTFNDQAAACFEMGGARFHIWFDVETRNPGTVLYKNPPLGVGRHDPGYFEARSLDATNKANARIVAALFAEIKDRKLVEAALAAEAQKAARQKEVRAATHQIHLRQAGPGLFEALKALANAAARANRLHHAGRPVPPAVWSELYMAEKVARAALQQAQEA